MKKLQTLLSARKVEGRTDTHTEPDRHCLWRFLPLYTRLFGTDTGHVFSPLLLLHLLFFFFLFFPPPPAVAAFRDRADV